MSLVHVKTRRGKGRKFNPPPWRPKRQGYRRPELSEEQILAWADEFHRRTGHWPRKTSGPILGGLGETWSAVDVALQKGHRGLTGGSSVPRLLLKHRGVPSPHARCLPRHSVARILAWADDHRQRTGQWPHESSGRILADPAESWPAVSMALREGCRGLPGDSSLAQLLAKHRGVRNRREFSPYTLKKILRWADQHERLTHQWPKIKDGPITHAPGETWLAVNTALAKGLRGLPAGSSLAQVLQEHRGVRNVRRLPPLTRAQILAWADAHHQRTGQWPKKNSGYIAGTVGETWRTVDAALHNGGRRLSGGPSLPQLLADQRGVRHHLLAPLLSVEKILSWCDSHYRRTGSWPRFRSGPIPEAPGESWTKVGTALIQGNRGLRGGSSLAQLLAQHRNVRNRMQAPPLSERKILRWADAYHRRTGQWPKVLSGPIIGAGGESWLAVDNGLRHGKRGMPGGSSLHRLLVKHGRKQHRRK